MTASKSTRRYGWRPSRPDHRDLHASFNVNKLVGTPRVDLSAGLPPCYDQGDLGSCTANAIAGALQYDEIKQQKADQNTPSRLFIYYNERYLDPFAYVSEDSGSTLRTGMKAVNTYGFCDESMWPYDTEKYADEPTADCYTTAKSERITAYHSLPQNLGQMKAALASGFPFVFGFTVFESFESDEVAKTGVVPMPDNNESDMGGHAVLCVGYDDPTQRFKVRNSWGPEWGQGGYFTIPYAYLTNPHLALDMWVVNSVP